MDPGTEAGQGGTPRGVRRNGRGAVPHELTSPRRLPQRPIGTSRSSKRGFPSVLLKSGDQAVVVCVRADPEPDHVVPLAHSKRTIGEPNANREDRSRGVDLLEAKARVVGILAEQLIRQPGSLPDPLR